MYSLYHSRAYSIIPYIALIMRRYNVFLPSLNMKCCLYLVFALHIISTHFPSSNNIVDLSLGRSVCRYAPGTSKLTTFLSLCASITMVSRSPSRVIIGNFPPYWVTNLLWSDPLAHILTFNFLLLFSFVRLTDLRDFWLFSAVMDSGPTPLSTYIYSIYLYSLNKTDIALSPKIL